MTIDINCDMGEGILALTNNSSVNADELIMPYISSANVACGAHAGSPDVITETIRLAKRYGVEIGAHPGYPDRENFGRKGMDMPHKVLADSLTAQILLVYDIASGKGMKLRHVKPHGALYNMAAKDHKLANLIAGVVQDIDSSLILVGLPSSALEHAAYAHGLRFAAEAFADRAYNDDGTLVGRNQPGAIIQHEEAIIERALMIIAAQSVISISGKIIPVPADTICIHGDNPGAPEFVKALAERMKSEGVQLRAFAGRSPQRDDN